MAYTLPSAADFKLRFPEFADVDNVLITNFIAVAAEEGVSPEVFREKDYAPAIMYLAAHFVMMYFQQKKIAEALGGEEAGGTSGGVTSTEISEETVKFEGHEVRTKAGSSSGTTTSNVSRVSITSRLDSVLSETPYGDMYLKLLNRNVMPIMIV